MSFVLRGAYHRMRAHLRACTVCQQASAAEAELMPRSRLMCRRGRQLIAALLQVREADLLPAEVADGR